MKRATKTATKAVATGDQLTQHLARLDSLTGEQIVALSDACRIDLVQTFDIVVDAGHAASDWHSVWEDAARRVREAASGSDDHAVQRAEVAASDACASTAVALHLGSLLPYADRRALMMAWRTTMEGQA